MRRTVGLAVVVVIFVGCSSSDDGGGGLRSKQDVQQLFDATAQGLAELFVQADGKADAIVVNCPEGGTASIDFATKKAVITDCKIAGVTISGSLVFDYSYAAGIAQVGLSGSLTLSGKWSGTLKIISASITLNTSTKKVCYTASVELPTTALGTLNIASAEQSCGNGTDAGPPPGDGAADGPGPKTDSGKTDSGKPDQAVAPPAPLTHVWSKRISPLTAGQAARDGAGNLYIAGYARLNVTPNKKDGYLYGVDSTGALRWLKSFGSITQDDVAEAVAVDGSGNVTVVGWTQSSSVNFGGTSLTGSTVWPDAVVASYDGSGAHRWSRRFGAGNGDDRLFGVATDSAGNVYVTGMVDGAFNPGGGAMTASGLVVVSYDSTGAQRWAKGFNASVAYGTGIAVAGSNVYLTGKANGSIDFGGGALASIGGHDIVVAALATADGAHVWSKRFGGGQSDQGLALAADSTTVLISASIGTAVDFGGGAIGSSKEQLALVAFDATGAHRWSLALPVLARPDSTSTYASHGVGLDAAGNAYVTGAFVSSAQLAGQTITAVGQRDAFLVSADGTGKPRWATSFGTAGATVVGYSPLVAASGNVTLLFTVTGPLDLGGGLLQGTSAAVALGEFAPKAPSLQDRQLEGLPPRWPTSHRPR